MSQVLPLAEARAAYTQVSAPATPAQKSATRERLLSTRLTGTLPGLAGQQIRWMLRDPRACCPN